jgi:hypothetical protein
VSGITTEQLTWVQQEMKALIENDPQTVIVTRYRTDTSQVPDSLDEKFGEVSDDSQIVYLSDELKCKWFWGITEEALQGVFGGSSNAEATLHFALDADVIERDYIERDGKDYWVIKIMKRDTWQEVYVEDSKRPT